MKNTSIFVHSPDGFSGDRIVTAKCIYRSSPVFCDPFPPLLRNLFIPDPFHHSIYPFEESECLERFWGECCRCGPLTTRRRRSTRWCSTGLQSGAASISAISRSRLLFSESQSWFGLVEFQMVRRLYLNGVNLVCFQVKDPNVLLLATFWMSPFL